MLFACKIYSILFPTFVSFNGISLQVQSSHLDRKGTNPSPSAAVCPFFEIIEPSVFKTPKCGIPFKKVAKSLRVFLIWFNLPKNQLNLCASTCFNKVSPSSYLGPRTATCSCPCLGKRRAWRKIQNLYMRFVILKVRNPL